MKCILMVLIGAPAVGKTTFAKELANNSYGGDKKYSFIHINYDQLLPQWELSKWKDNRQNVIALINDIIKGLLFETQSNELAYVIIIDDNMYYRSMRLEYYRLAQTLNCGFCQVYFQSELHLSLNANLQRPSSCQVPPTVIENIFKKMDVPNLSNKWEKNTVFLKAFENFDKAELLTLIENTFMDKTMLQPLSSSTKPEPKDMTTSKVHTLDLILRKHISKRVAEEKGILTKHELQCFIFKLLELKTKLMSSVRKGDILIPDDDLTSFLEKAFGELIL